MPGKRENDMSAWTNAELAAIANDENLYISIPNPDGSLHKPAWIWVVQVDNDLYCRGYAGTSARWYRAARDVGHGHISVGGVEKDVVFAFPTDDETNDRVDAGYRAKYSHSRYLEPMIGKNARAATVRLIPKEGMRQSW